jgi:hypothetical protein
MRIIGSCIGEYFVCMQEQVFSNFPRFSLSEGALTTYDSYPERTLPDGRVSTVVMSTVSHILIRPLASWLVVRHPRRMARRSYPKPGSLASEDGPLTQANATWHRQFRSCCRNLA